MNRLTKKKTDKVIIITVIVLLCNFVMPNYVQAADGGVIFKYVIPTMLMIPDLLLEKLQKIFVDEKSSIAVRDPKNGISHYSIMYSPGAIFSGKLAGFDVNFISPLGDDNGIVRIPYKTYIYNDDPVKIDSYEQLKNEYGLPENIEENLSTSKIMTHLLWFRNRYSFLYMETRRYNFRRRSILLVLEIFRNAFTYIAICSWWCDDYFWNFWCIVFWWKFISFKCKRYSINGRNSSSR